MKGLFRKTASTGAQLDALDGLRGLAVLLVLFSHLDHDGMGAIPFVNFDGAGKYGVFLFFVLSAFLLTLLQLSRPPDQLHNLSVWGMYFRRRALRIFPLYTFVLVTNCLLRSAGYASFSAPIPPMAILRHLALLQGVDVFWTIPIECKYYLLLPIVVIIYAALRRVRPVAVFGVSIATIVLTDYALWNLDDLRYTLSHLGPYLPTFLLGSLGAYVHLQLQRATRMHSQVRAIVFELAAWVACALVVLHIASVFNTLLGGQIPPNYFHLYPTRLGVLWVVCLVGLLNGTGFMKSALSIRPLRFVGIISFSIYLWHTLILRIVSHYLPGSGLVRGWAVIVFALAVSSVTYVLIERPILEYGARRAAVRPPALPNGTRRFRRKRLST